MAFFKGTATDYQDFLTVLKNLAKDDHISAAAVLNGGTGYAVNDTITLAGGTKYHEPELEVLTIGSGDYVTGAVVNAGGTGYAVGDELYPAAGTYSVTPVIEVTSVSGGVVTGVQINNPGISSSNPTNPVSTTTDGSGINCTLDLTFTTGSGIITGVHISDSGVYTTQATNPVSQNTSSGSGTGAKFTVTYTDTAWDAKIDFTAQEATAAAISAAGTGYTLNDIVTIVGGTFTEAATVKITAVSSGVPTAVAVNTGGTYSATPSNPASTSGGTGSGLTLTMTWANQVLEQKFLMLHNTNSDQYIGFRTFKETSPEVAYLIQVTGFTGFNSVSTPWEQQPGSTAPDINNGFEDTYVPLSGGASPATVNYWMSIHDSRIVAAFKVASVYPNMYAGGLDPFMTTSEYAYPQLILGCIARKRPYTYGGSDFAGMNNPGCWLFGSTTLHHGPGVLRDPSGVLHQVQNWEISQNKPLYVKEEGVKITPCAGTDFSEPASPNDWQNPSIPIWQDMFEQDDSIHTSQDALKRISNLFMLLPCTAVQHSPRRIYGNMRGVFCFNPDGTINAEDRIFIGSDVYTCFQNCGKSNRNYFFALKEE